MPMAPSRRTSLASSLWSAMAFVHQVAAASAVGSCVAGSSTCAPEGGDVLAMLQRTPAVPLQQQQQQVQQPQQQQVQQQQRQQQQQQMQQWWLLAPPCRIGEEARCHHD